MKSLRNEADLADLIDRLNALKPDAAAVWGRMSAHQMLCHCSDTARMATGERPVPVRKRSPFRTPMKWWALYCPWPKGVPTRRQLDQLRDGTKPQEFARDRADLIEVLTSFSRQKDKFGMHVLFGELTTREWMRLGYRHVDHHLRQFGA
jgi:hypothetical protein